MLPPMVALKAGKAWGPITGISHILLIGGLITVFRFSVDTFLISGR